MENHEKYMKRCLQLAELGKGSVAPNPLVGSVLVHNGRIIGEGFHADYGGNHAEINCLDSVKEEDETLISKSTLYVSLEPCNHTGQTPPCTQRIMQEGIRKVVIGMRDPSIKPRGSGSEFLRKKGVEVFGPVMEKESRWENRIFVTVHEKHRPYVILKWAESADGIVGRKSKDRLMITGEATRKLVHKWRTENDAILIGYNTALYDNPQLTSRDWPGKNATPVLISPKLGLPRTLNIFNTGIHTLVFNVLTNDKLQDAECVKIPEENFNPEGWLQELHKRQLSSVIVEGGASTIQRFIDSGLWDEIRVLRNSKLFAGEGVPAPSGYSGKLNDKFSVENDEVSIILNEAY